MVKYKTETFRSAVVKKNLNPVWDFTCRIGDTDDCTQGGMVTIAVWDSDMGRDEKIGEISVQIAAMQTSSEPVQLQLAGKKAKDSKIFVTYTVNEAADASVGAAGGAATADGGGETKGTDRETKDLDSDEERRGLDPNMLIVDIIKAEGLKAADRGGVSDPQVTLYCGGKKYVSKEIKNTINPTWGERCRFPVTKHSSAKEKKLRIQIDDLDVAMHDLLGSCEVDLESLKPHTITAKTLNLFDVKYNKITPNAKAALGKLYIRVEWTHDEDEATTTGGFLGMGRAKIKREDIGVDEVLGEHADDGEEKEGEAKKETEDEKTKREAEEAAHAEIMERVTINPGEYQVKVHIMEARDLKGMDASGLSDPVVYMECFNQKQHSKVKPQTTSCVWDDVFFFNQKDVDPDELEEMVIKVRC